GAPGGRASDRPRWTDDARGRPAVGHPARHGQDPHDARPGRPAGAAGMTYGEVGMNQWHLDPEAIRRYAQGAARPELAASAEAHLMKCAACRAAMTSYV